MRFVKYEIYTLWIHCENLMLFDGKTTAKAFDQNNYFNHNNFFTFAVRKKFSLKEASAFF